MYFLYLFLTAFLILSIISTNWPLKLYHYYRLNQLAVELETTPLCYGRLFSHSFAELRTFRQGQELVIRFREGSVDSLRSNTGLEIRSNQALSLLFECYRLPARQRERGNFKQWRSGEATIDSQWLILTPHAEQLAEFWNAGTLNRLLNSSRQLEQVLVSDREIILNLRRFESPAAVKRLAEQLLQLA